MSSNTFYHSVRLDAEKCVGCTNCIKRCPTEAIRVRGGKAHIISARCVDCGECIRICPSHAKYAESYPLSEMHAFRYKVALPSPELYGQFNNLDDTDIVLNGLLELGFDDVFEVAAAAELISEETRLYMAEHPQKKPLISSACPAIVRLIRVRFPNLIENLLDLNPPMEQAAQLARKRAVEKTGFAPEEIGVFFLSPCTAQVSAIKQPICNSASAVSGVFGIKDIYPFLLQKMEALESTKTLSHSGLLGMSWATSGGEAAAMLCEQYLAADGIENCIEVLEEVEDERLGDLDFIELRACPGGCVGGPLTVENPYVARARLQSLRKYAPLSLNHLEEKALTPDMFWEHPLEEVGVLRLDPDISTAMQKMQQLKKIESCLPGLDCGTCGAPSCRDLAEDIVRGMASIEDCVFSESNAKIENGYIPIPVPFRKTKPSR